MHWTLRDVSVSHMYCLMSFLFFPGLLYLDRAACRPPYLKNLASSNCPVTCILVASSSAQSYPIAPNEFNMHLSGRCQWLVYSSGLDKDTNGYFIRHIVAWHTWFGETVTVSQPQITALPVTPYEAVKFGQHWCSYCHKAIPSTKASTSTKTYLSQTERSLRFEGKRFNIF